MTPSAAEVNAIEPKAMIGNAPARVLFVQLQCHRLANDSHCVRGDASLHRGECEVSGDEPYQSIGARSLVPELTKNLSGANAMSSGRACIADGQA